MATGSSPKKRSQLGKLTKPTKPLLFCPQAAVYLKILPKEQQMELDRLSTDFQAARQEQNQNAVWLKALQSRIMI